MDIKRPFSSLQSVSNKKKALFFLLLFGSILMLFFVIVYFSNPLSVSVPYSKLKGTIFPYNNLPGYKVVRTATCGFSSKDFSIVKQLHMAIFGNDVSRSYYSKYQSLCEIIMLEAKGKVFNTKIQIIKNQACLVHVITDNDSIDIAKAWISFIKQLFPKLPIKIEIIAIEADSFFDKEAGIFNTSK